MPEPTKTTDIPTQQLLLGTSFEDSYLLRTHKTLTSNSIVALTELVANAWDAGASLVKISIPDELEKIISIEDNGTGMTYDEFKKRWMTLSYNREQHQGKIVQFPPGTGIPQKRTAFGRNGVGRHGMICFADEYTVDTCKDLVENVINVTSTQKEKALAIISQRTIYLADEKHGTILSAKIMRNRPDPEKLLDELAKRFITDPSFRVEVNGKAIDSSDIIKDAQRVSLSVSTGDGNQEIKLDILLIDTARAHKKSSYQGIAFWQANRLVGEPSWTLGKNAVIDGRTQIAKRYTFIVQSEDLAPYINEDWTGFINCSTMDLVYSEITKKIEELMGDLNKKNIQSIRASVQEEHKEEYNSLSPLGQYEVNEVIEHVVTNKPMITAESLSIAVDAVINLEKSRNGLALLQKLSAMGTDEIDALYKLLNDWSVRDALCVLEEIEKRVSVIEALNKLHNDKTVDELHTLHPLITASRWVFGPEFDSPEYVSNSQLRSLAKRLFNINDACFIEPTRRPDLIVKGEFTYGLTGIEEIDDNDISSLKKILLIELKRGGFVIDKKEVHQAEDYVRELFDSGTLGANCRISAFVVGDDIESKSLQNSIINDVGTVRAITFTQVIDTANIRLFKLRDILAERYANVPGMELASKAHQLQMGF